MIWLPWLQMINLEISAAVAQPMASGHREKLVEQALGTALVGEHANLQDYDTSKHIQTVGYPVMCQSSSGTFKE